MKNKITISGREIGVGFPPYIIAEMSANHNGSLSNAFKIIDSAQEMGAHAVKIQTYTPDTLTLDSYLADFVIDEGLWAGKTLYSLYEQAYTPWDWHADLFSYSEKKGMTIFSTPFDTTAVDLLEDLNAPAYKIASFEATDLHLIRYAASTKKPLIISTGMADATEIEEAIDAALTSGCTELAILHCVSGYPAPHSNYNLRTIADMTDRFGVVVGLSDHTLDNTTAIASVALGSCIIEKHFTLDRNGGGPDDSFSMEPFDLKLLIESTQAAFEAVGSVDYGLKSSEIANIKFRRSLYFVKPLLAGEIITEDSVRSIRPGYGLAPKYYEDVVGKRVKVDVQFATPVKSELFE